ncbi:hypothetical protein [Mariniluteicoccus endophyticus]
MVARRLASRLPVVRAAAAETAYAAEEYQTALSEFRALRRMTGDQEFLPVMADCERALGRPEEALEIAREAAKLELEPATRVEMRIVEAGARSDMGQRNEALRLLRGEIQATNKGAVPPGARARVRYAYADLLLAGGDEAAARDWFQAAAQLDVDHGTDAADRVAALDGFVLEYDESEEYDDREEVDSHGDEGAGSDGDVVSGDENPVADRAEEDVAAPARHVDEKDDFDE